MTGFSRLFTPLIFMACCFSNPALAENSHQGVGTSIARIANWATGVPFVDLFKSAAPFSAPASVAYNARGWPTGLPDGVTASTVVMHNTLTPALPAGNYVVTYKGDGELEYSGSVSLLESLPGRDVLYIDPTASQTYLELNITRSSFADPIRDIHITLPGGICAANPFIRVDSAALCPNGDYRSFEDHHTDIIFNPGYLNFVKDFRVMRLMDFMRTNASLVSTWNDRTKLDHAVWSLTSGAPVEVMVALANKANISPWFTIPHLADDNYVRQFARYVRDHLNPDLKAYVEYSNEVWSDKAQGNYAKNLGLQLGLAVDWNEAGAKYYAQRSVEIFKAWENEFGGLNRIVRVLAGQLVNVWLTGKIVEHQNAYQHADVFGVNAYISGDINYYRNQAQTVTDVFAEMRNPNSRFTLPYQLQNVRDQINIINQYGLGLVAFEGGQSLVDWITTTDTQHPNPLFDAANRDPRIGDIYRDLLNGWKNAGGQLFVHYSSPGHYSKSGNWGVQEYLGQPRSEAHKYNALLNFMDSTPCWWTGCENSNPDDNGGGNNDSGSGNNGDADNDNGSNNGGGQNNGSAVNFDSISAGDYNTVTENGYTFFPASGATLSIVNAANSQSISPYWGDTMIMEKSDGSAFNLAKFDVRSRWAGLSAEVVITGHFNNGSEIREAINYNGDDWTEKVLNWRDLSQVGFYSPNGRTMIDNLFSESSSGGNNSGNGNTGGGSGSGGTTTATVDFESSSANDHNTLVINGYNFTPLRAATFSIIDDGSTRSLSPYWGDSLRIEKADGSTFDLNELDITGRWPGISSEVEITAIFSNGTKDSAAVAFAGDRWVNRVFNWSKIETLELNAINGRAMYDNFQFGN